MLVNKSTSLPTLVNNMPVLDTKVLFPKDEIMIGAKKFRYENDCLSTKEIKEAVKKTMKIKRYSEIHIRNKLLRLSSLIICLNWNAKSFFFTLSNNKNITLLN